MAIKYICISDLHLGAQYSLLTGLNTSGALDAKNGSCPTLESLADAFDALLKNLDVDNNTRLVLLGDVLDMGFSSTADTIAAFRVFANTFLAKPQLKKISNSLLYIPGNHDHQLWQDEKNNHLLKQVLGGDVDDSLMQVTKLLNPEHLESRLLKDICESLDFELDIQIAYPNVAVEVDSDDNNKRALVMSHGHYLESTYLIVSRLKSALLGELNISSSISEIERTNGYWVNGLWSNLGNMGLGPQALEMYQTLLDAGASHQVVRSAATKITNYLANEFGITSADLSITKTNVTVNQAVKALMDVLIGRLGSSERNDYSAVLSSNTIKGLKWYLSEVVAEQFSVHRNNEMLPNDVRFIFGHTHKPFQDQIPIAGYERPVQVFNTGGWAIDKPVNAPIIGGAIVFVDEQLNVESLRLYNCSTDCPIKAPWVGGSDSDKDSTNPLHVQLSKALKQSSSKWKDFSKEVAHAVELRQDLALNRYFDPHSINGVKAPRRSI